MIYLLIGMHDEDVRTKPLVASCRAEQSTRTPATFILKSEGDVAGFEF